MFHPYTPCGCWPATPSRNSSLLAVPQWEFEAGHPSRDGDQGGHRGDLQKALLFTASFLAVDPPSLPPTAPASRWSRNLSSPREEATDRTNKTSTKERQADICIKTLV